ncbi:MAG: alanine--tRNA ligase [Pseudomonadales bacterium]|nr:alanine--tRNA ligase [Pseudomonadales bacterium]
MDSRQLRQAFLEFFASRGHQIVESSSLVPDNDPTLLFTNAGMVQFKDAFALRENRGYSRAVSCQRCIRAGGKHNDLDNVGYTTRHHTFFEMLGNFSFGDYFKEEAIAFAWEFLIDEVKLPSERLWVTIHTDDDEAFDIWTKKIGFDPARITRLDDNFWTMGDTGPCGPNSEIFYDHGPEIPGGPPGTPDEDMDRYVEIWNLVFTQYDRAKDGTLTPLPRPCVDTGMGMERVAAILQGVYDNYDIDLFVTLRDRVAELIGVQDIRQPSVKVIADHVRSAAFLISDGVLPSNAGRGYVMRRIIRRALRHGHKLQAKGPFFHKLVDTLVELMGDNYPLLVSTKDQIEKILLKEEKQFEVTLDQGMRLLGEAIAELEGTEIPGEIVFKLYDTYGFPTDLTEDIARERDLALDIQGFEHEMQLQKERARAASKFASNELAELDVDYETTFVGYDSLDGESTVLALFRADKPAESLAEGNEGILVVDSTPFYAESGGQVGDTGQFFGNGVSIKVLDTVKNDKAFIHKVAVIDGSISVGDSLSAEVDARLRNATRRNHSATHLLHAALREVLGDHVNQRGSLVEPDRLRFDFSHFEEVTRDELQIIERKVNEQIRNNSDVQTDIMDLEQAKEHGAMALFGEKYSEKVRVLTMGEGYSIELCGGTHANHTGDIGVFQIIDEHGIASGVRRIEATTGEHVIDRIQNIDSTLKESMALLRADRSVDILGKLTQLIEQNKRLEKEVSALNMKLASGAGNDSSNEAIDLGGAKLIVNQMEGADAKTLPEVLDRLKNKIGSGVVVLASVNGDKVSLIAGVTKDLTDSVHAGKLVNHVAEQVGGKGGGRPDMARAGGNNVADLPAALESVRPYVEANLS